MVVITFTLLLKESSVIGTCYPHDTGPAEVFITGQAKLNLNTIQSNVWAADKFITADILFLSVVL